ncbi:MAG: hypothetical protein ABIX01_18365 [Chitinophagaceae bacterium]
MKFPIFFPCVLSALLLTASSTRAQVTLNADGPGNTYELINSVFAPGYTAVEAPDQCSSHPSFGRHVAELWDADLNQYVFEFYIHVPTSFPVTATTPDNDRCINFDRQRVEIKTYESSPDNLKGTLGETITYKWKFKVPVGFQPSSSFTHIHQIKAVGGDESDPLFTITVRKGTPNKIELIYVPTSGLASNKVSVVNLSLFEGQWVEATEVVKVGANGTYSMTIKRVNDGTTLIAYSNANIATIRPDNSFIRPKWGIYRSLNTPSDLRDESLRFANFSIAEGSTNAQAYYWTGGTAIKSLADDVSWNTAVNGGGSTRLALGPKPEDVFIFDGTNIGGAIPASGVVTATIPTLAIGQLKLQNNAAVVFQRPLGGGGTGVITIGGDGTPAPDFEVQAGSSLAINSPNADGAVNMGLTANATGLVGGTITIANTGGHRITAQVVNGLDFIAGAVFNSDGIPTSAVYPFGNNTQGVQNGVVFEAGANLVVTGSKSPMGNVSTFQACNMLPGSNFYMRSSNAVSSGAWTNLKTYGNIFVESGATLTADGPFYKIENLTIDNGCALITHTSGNTPVLGNLLVNGSLAAPVGSTNLLVMGGTAAQIISGTGTIAVPSLTVANYSTVKLSKTASVSTICNVMGQLQFGAVGQVAGAGSFTARIGSTAATVTGNTTAGSYLVTGIVGTLSGNAGLSITGAGIDATTNVVGFSSSNAIINLSKPALASATGVSLSFASDSATLEVANPNGMDSITGCVAVTGLKTFQSGTNYTIDQDTGWPFGISSSAPPVITVGKVVINAYVSTNHHVNIRGGLYVNAGNLTVRSIDSVQVFTLNSGPRFLPSVARFHNMLLQPFSQSGLVLQALATTRRIGYCIAKW